MKGLTAKEMNERQAAARAVDCVHFTGIQNKQCAAGVLYDTLRIDGTLKGMPCLPSLLKGPPAVECALYRARTAEELAEENKQKAESWERMKVALKFVATWRTHPKPAVSRGEVVVCPCCQGRLHLSQSSYNGHVHGRCETEGCVSWME